MIYYMVTQQPSYQLHSLLQKFNKGYWSLNGVVTAITWYQIIVFNSTLVYWVNAICSYEDDMTAWGYKCLFLWMTMMYAVYMQICHNQIVHGGTGSR